MRQLLVTKGTINYGLSTATGDITGANQLDLLADGSLVCLESDGTFVDDTTPNITKAAILFALGRTTNGPLVTPLIDIASMAYKKTAYTAPAAKVMVIGSTTNGGTTYNCNLPSSPTVGTVATVTVIDESKSFDNISRQRIYEYPVKTGDTAATVEVAMIAKINADSLRIVNAVEVDATNHDGFKLTGITAGKNFNVVCGGILVNADVLGYNEIINAGTAGITAGATTGLALVAPWVPGFGTSDQIAAIELDYSTELGNTGLQAKGTDLFNLTSRVVPGATYVTYIITWVTSNDNVLIPKPNMTQMVTIAVPSGDTAAGKTIAALDTILASL